MGTITYTDISPRAHGDDLVTEWVVIKFTDEAIDNIKMDSDSGLLFATTISGAIWVSSDKGETWKLQSELLKEAAVRYEHQVEDSDKPPEIPCRITIRSGKIVSVEFLSIEDANRFWLLQENNKPVTLIQIK